MFQSTPAIAGGRTPQPGGICAPGQCGFNPRPPLLAGEPLKSVVRIRPIAVSIHARHCWRANQVLGQALLVGKLFQSTPAIAGGRTSSQGVGEEAQDCFNPRPPLLAGEPPRGLIHQPLTWSFNPRPPLLAGEPSTRMPYTIPVMVSIHARHCWRANHRIVANIKRLPVVSIHARHCWRANLRKR